MAENARFLQKIERRQCLDALAPLMDMSETTRQKFLLDLEMPASTPNPDIVARLADVALSASREDRPTVIASLLASAHPKYDSYGAPAPARAPVPALLVSGAAAPPSYTMAVQGSRMIQETSLDRRDEDITHASAPPQHRAMSAVTFPNAGLTLSTSSDQDITEMVTTPPPGIPLSSRAAPCTSSPNKRSNKSIFSCLAKILLKFGIGFKVTLLCIMVLMVYVVDLGTVTAVANTKTRKDTQIYAGVTGGFVWWWLGMAAMYFFIWAGKVFRRGSEWDILSIVTFGAVVLFGFAITIPIAVLFANGVQGVLYYAKISIVDGVKLEDIPIYSSVQAYRTVNGAFVQSSYHLYQDVSYDHEDGSVNQYNAYMVKVVSNVTNSFDIWAVYSDEGQPGTYWSVFNGGVFQRSLVRLDCERDDPCAFLSYAVSLQTERPYLLMRNKDPSDRYNHYFDIMQTYLIAAGVFFALIMIVLFIYGVFEYRRRVASLRT